MDGSQTSVQCTAAVVLFAGSVVRIYTHTTNGVKRGENCSTPPCLFSVLLQLLRTIKGSALKIVCVLKKERVLLSVSMLPFYHASFFKVQTTKTEQNQSRSPHENCFFYFTVCANASNTQIILNIWAESRKCQCFFIEHDVKLLSLALPQGKPCFHIWQRQ